MTDEPSEKNTGSSKPAASSGAESPRTAREPDFDDDVHETHLAAPERQVTPTQKRVSFQDDVGPAPPPKPSRPMSPQAQAEATLIEAFPSIDAKVVKAVLVASHGKVEPAFNALLSMSDPDFVQDLPPPPPPPRKTQPQSQLESDEAYARQLAEEYGDDSYTGFGARGQGNPPLPSRRRETGLKPNELHDKEHSFFDDDLPVITENIQKGFQETKKTINKWITDFQKKLDGDEDDDPVPQPGPSQPRRQDFGPSQSNQLHGIRKSAETTRRSGERDRYDADPQVLSDDFGHRLELRDEEAAPKRPPRPLANPDLFRPSTTSAGTDDLATATADHSRDRQPSPSAGGAKQGKWQPLTSVEPDPETEDHDPFSLGDSDEETDIKKDIRPEDTERLKKAAAEAGGSTKPAEGAPELKPADGKGTAQKAPAEP